MLRNFDPMKVSINALLSIALILGCAIKPSDHAQNNEALTYPETRKDDTEDLYHGVKIADPYRWLEDDHSEETKAWVNSQNEVTNRYLADIPYHSEIKDRLTELWNFERFGTPFKRGGKYYFFHNDGLQNQSVLYVQTSLDDAPQVVLDPNQFSADGTIALSSVSFNRQGDKLAYVTSSAGSDWSEIKVFDLETGRTLDDIVQWVKFSSVAWHGDGFYYSRFPEPQEEQALSGSNQYHHVYYHTIGTTQAQDKSIMQNEKEPKRLFYAGTTDDQRFLHISESVSSDGNALYVRDLKTMGPLTKVLDSFDYDNDVMGSIGDQILVRTTKDAPNGKLIGIRLSDPGHPIDIIPPRKDVLVEVHLAGGRIFATYLEDAKSVVRVFDEQGRKEQMLDLPGIGTLTSFSGRKEDEVAFYSFTSYTMPTTVFRLDTDALKSQVFKQPDLAFDFQKYETKQVFYHSKDGTRIPMFITASKQLSLYGENPTLLYGYGGFNVSLTPSFSVTTLALLERGGIFAVPNIRGGGEYGKEWHKAGTLDRKQNVFDDFIAAAEFLTDHHYTQPNKLAIMGGSNGGLLVGACMIQRPDLFQVAVPRVGVLDMLRYHTFTIGWAWADDYGTSDDPASFDYLIKYSPLHNLDRRAYPSTLVMTADHDDRVVPAHSFKFAATLQEKHTRKNPTLIRIEESAGHGAGKPTSKLIEESADMLSFILYNLDEDHTTR